MPGKELWFGRKVEGFVLNCNVIPCTTGESMKPCLHQCQKLTHHLGLSIVAVQARENTLSFLYYETEAPQDVWNNERLSKLYLYTCISSTNNHHKTPTFSTLCDFFFFFYQLASMRSTYAVLLEYIQFAGGCSSYAFRISHSHHWIMGSISQRVSNT